MKHLSKAFLALFLTVFVLSGCKKNDIEQAESVGSGKGGSKTSALRTIYVSANLVTMQVPIPLVLQQVPARSVYLKLYRLK